MWTISLLPENNKFNRCGDIYIEAINIFCRQRCDEFLFTRNFPVLQKPSIFQLKNAFIYFLRANEKFEVSAIT